MWVDVLGQSFSKRYEYPIPPNDANSWIQTLRLPDGRFGFTVSSGPETEAYQLLMLSDSTGYRVRSQDGMHWFPTFSIPSVGLAESFQYLEGYFFLGLNNGLSFSGVPDRQVIAAFNPDSNTRFTWVAANEGRRMVSFNFSAFNEIIIAHGTSRVGAFRLDAPNAAQWTYSYTSPDYPTPSIFMGYEVQVIRPRTGGGYSLIGRLSSDGLATDTIGQSFILHIDATGNVERARVFELGVDIKSHTIDELGNVYLAAGFLDLMGSVNPRDPKQKPLIIKLSPELDFLQAVVLELPGGATAFTWQIEATHKGIMYSIFVFGGQRPSIIGRLDTDLNELSRKGYPLLVGAHFEDTGSFTTAGSTLYDTQENIVEYAYTIRHTDSEGNIEGCPDIPVCLSIRDTVVSLSPVEFVATPTEPHYLRTQPLDFEPISFGMSPFCQDYVTPRAVFELPDTLCAGGLTLRPTGLNDQGADATRWSITGPGIDTSFSFWPFSGLPVNTPGEYNITYQVWLLGCEDVYERRLVILDSLRLSDDLPRYICPDAPLAIDLDSNRPLDSVWVDSNLLVGHLLLSEPGIYQLIATDGYCTVSDSLTLARLEDDYPPPWLLLDSAHYALCPEFFPLELKPSSPYTTSFALGADAPTAAPLQIATAGNYEVVAEVANCRVSSPLEVEAVDCSPQVYIPNAFSPNGDGVNDQLMPFGVNFQATKLQVYDRWGGLVYTDTSSAPSWNGRKNGKVATMGVYVVVFEFVNLKNGEPVVVSQDVMLSR